MLVRPSTRQRQSLWMRLTRPIPVVRRAFPTRMYYGLILGVLLRAQPNGNLEWIYLASHSVTS